MTVPSEVIAKKRLLMRAKMNGRDTTILECAKLYDLPSGYAYDLAVAMDRLLVDSGIPPLNIVKFINLVLDCWLEKYSDSETPVATDLRKKIGL